MKINRMAEENQIPNWALNGKGSEYFEKETMKIDDINKIATASELSEADLVIEKDKIEQCASSNSIYHYSMSWSSSVRSELKEYAMVCGMNMAKFKGVNPSAISHIEASSNNMVKTASASSNIVLSDPFKLDEKIANVHEKSKWSPEVTKEAKLSDKPAMSGIVPIRGGEDYLSNTDAKVARGQNSISDPDAISKLAESTIEDNGARLRRQNLEKEEAKKTRHDEWQQEKIASMEGKEILPNRYVFPTESMNAQPGIKGEVFDFSKIPDKTEGEKIRESNEARRKEIRGEEKDKYEFKLERSANRGISDTFADELKKHLNQID